MTRGFKSAVDQTKSGVAAIALCIVQTLAESDPTFRERIEPRLADWYRRLSERGEPHGAELVWMVARALRDPNLWPSG